MGNTYKSGSNHFSRFGQYASSRTLFELLSRRYDSDSAIKSMLRIGEQYSSYSAISDTLENLNYSITVFEGYTSLNITNVDDKDAKIYKML